MPPKILSQYSPSLNTAWHRLLHTMSRKTKYAFSQGGLELLLTYASHPGKFVRPTLFLASYEIHSGKRAMAQMRTLALSLEFLHLYLLIHDDIMDQSKTRRGQPSLYKLFETYHLKNKLKGDRVLFGRNMAILMGDVVANQAEILWTQAISSNIATPTMRHFFDDMKQEVYWGQYLDLLAPAQPSPPSLETILTIMREKTGRYTIIRPLQIGAVVAGADPKSLQWIEDFGRNLGIAFQAIDDLLGTYGKSQETGKPTQSDIAERKWTPLVYYAFCNASPAEREVLTRHYQENSLDSKEYATIKTIFTKTKAHEQTQLLADTYYQKSLAVLHQAPIQSRHKKLLQEFADFILMRNY
jgi:geranylgeranyl diphosphate synthase type I